ncbi:MAG: hypothetical protein R2747_13715 [Pyrinomonadaceae bacterium]
MLKTDLSVSAEIKLLYDLHIPDRLETPAPLIISVHGYGAHKNYMLREGKLIADQKFAVASLQGPHQFYREAKDGAMKVGFGWLTNYRSPESVALHHKFVLDVIERLSAEGLIDDERIYLFGFSQSCALNFRFAFTYPDILRGVIGVCGGIPSDLDTNEIYRPTEADVLYLYGDQDEFYPLEKFQTFEQRLKEYLPNFDCLRYRAEHEITGEMREDIKGWLEKAGD